MPKPAAHQINIPATGESFTCKSGQALLAAMVKLGRKGIPAGCLNGGCGVCKIRVLQGSVRSGGPISRAHVSAEEESEHITLACRAIPTTDVSLEILGKMKKSFSASSRKPGNPEAISV
ncbi:MAG: 2Fe-2S iron-sulfur cluster-binding protein [Thiolinea sp.]